MSLLAPEIATDVKSPQQTAWAHLAAVSRKWLWKPDFQALRVCLATAKALDVQTSPIWLMVVGPSSSGKTDFLSLAARGYSPHYETDDISLPGLMSMKMQNKGKGVLQNLGSKGLWVINDYSTVLELSEEKRNAVNSACRRIFEGSYSRSADGETERWKGKVNVIACCTNSIEKYTKHTADLGERFINLRVSRPEACDEISALCELQRANIDQYRLEITTAAKMLLNPGVRSNPTVPIEMQRKIIRLAEIVAICRVQTERNWKEEITKISEEEGAPRVTQQLLSLAAADAALFGHKEVTLETLDTLKRVAFDSIPKARSAVIRVLALDPTVSVRKMDLQELCGIVHPFTFERAIDELTDMGVIKSEIPSPGVVNFSLTDRPKKLLTEILSPMK